VHHCMLAVTASAWQNLGRQDTVKVRASYTMFVRSPALHGQWAGCSVPDFVGSVCRCRTAPGKLATEPLQEVAAVALAAVARAPIGRLLSQRQAAPRLRHLLRVGHQMQLLRRHCPPQRQISQTPAAGRKTHQPARSLRRQSPLPPASCHAAAAAARLQGSRRT
jgi:hypothetical protein